jgi:hypothetical protein
MKLKSLTGLNTPQIERTSARVPDYSMIPVLNIFSS